MVDGKKLVDILDTYLKENGLSRRKFCLEIGIPNSTVASWKFKNILPPLETLVKIARYMNVSLDWLVFGEMSDGAEAFNNLENTCSRASILYRIGIVLRQNNTDYDYDIESLHKKYLSDIVDYEVLINWVNGRNYLPEDVLPKIAEKLKVPLQWLLTKDEYHQEDFNAYIYGLAVAYSSLLKGYDCLDKDDQKFIDSYIAMKLENRQMKNELEFNKKLGDEIK